MPPYPHFRALYAVPVRQVRGLLTASFRFRLTADTLAVRLCASLLPTRTHDLHPLEPAHGGRTKNRHTRINSDMPVCMPVCFTSHSQPFLVFSDSEESSLPFIKQFLTAANLFHFDKFTAGIQGGTIPLCRIGLFYFQFHIAVKELQLSGSAVAPGIFPLK